MHNLGEGGDETHAGHLPSFNDAFLSAHYAVFLFLCLISVSSSTSDFLFFHSLTRKWLLCSSSCPFYSVHLNFLPPAAGTGNQHILKIKGDENLYLPPPGMQESWGLPQCDVFFPSYLKQINKNRGVHFCDCCD